MLSPIADVKRRAKQLSFGFEAADKLSVGSYADSEAAKMARGAFELDLSATRRRVDNAYATGSSVALSSASRKRSSWSRCKPSTRRFGEQL